MIETGVKIEAARSLAGYAQKSSAAFNRSFKAFYGCSPDVWRAETGSR
jgi:AraC-like DNA-binding protein